MERYTLFFDEIDKKDLPLVGGKGANLGEMTRAGINVPHGFCVTTESYKEFIARNNLADPISQLIKDASLDNINQIGEEIRKKVSQSEIPKQVEQEIVKALHNIGQDKSYAVRSSATAEALVSGLVSPDLYKYNKSRSQIESKTIAEKKLAIMSIEGGGTHQLAITRETSTRQVIDDTQIKNLAELGIAIEKHYGCPQDIE